MVKLNDRLKDQHWYDGDKSNGCHQPNKDNTTTPPKGDKAVTSKKLLYFHSVDMSKVLPDKTRALVKDKDGDLSIAVWFADSKEWIDEGGLIYAGGMGGEVEVVEFALI